MTKETQCKPDPVKDLKSVVSAVRADTNIGRIFYETSLDNPDQLRELAQAHATANKRGGARVSMQVNFSAVQSGAELVVNVAQPEQAYNIIKPDHTWDGDNDDNDDVPF